MGSWASKTTHLPPEVAEKIWELYPGLTYEEAVEDQVILSQVLEESMSSGPATRSVASSNYDPFSHLKAEAEAFSASNNYDPELDEAITRSLQDELDHLSISESHPSGSGSRGNDSGSSSNTTGASQAPAGADGESYEELAQLCETVGNESKGLSPENISRLRTFEYKGNKSRFSGKKAKSGGEDKTTECSICYMEFENGQNITALPCMHQYHKKCITRWLADNKVCPICRVEVQL